MADTHRNCWHNIKRLTGPDAKRHWQHIFEGRSQQVPGGPVTYASEMEREEQWARERKERLRQEAEERAIQQRETDAIDRYNRAMYERSQRPAQLEYWRQLTEQYRRAYEHEFGPQNWGPAEFRY